MEEKTKLISDFEKVVSYSQDFSSPKVEELIDDCLSKKEYFINLFGGELIYEIPEPISFELSEEDKKKKVMAFCDTLECTYGLSDMANFVLTQYDSFYSNRVGKNYTTKNGIGIVRGMRLLKAFRFFVEDEGLLRRLQDDASEIIQSNKITGTLCFSVHPLDFLSMSESNYNWRSCHALNGEYRAGNLSYMEDDCTFMCYLRSDEKTILPDFPSTVPWNNKKWRVLLYLSNNKDMMFAGRQYPFTADSALKILKELMQKHFSFGEWTEWQNDKIRNWKISNEQPTFFNSPYIGVGNSLVPLTTLVQDKDKEHTLHFNDVLRSSYYDPFYSYKKGASGWFDTVPITKKSSRFLVGGKVKCLKCNQDYINCHETFMCNNCELEYGTSESEEFANCPRCGNRFLIEDGTYVDTEYETVCSRCAFEYVEYCERCGEAGYVDQSSMIYHNGVFYCSYCYNHYVTEEE